ncbi:FG-GAP repeat domain-containing protein [Rhodocytophaga rosea]|nr:VCBS repeat-containing protein [Rhodocytophaga rosea]
MSYKLCLFFICMATSIMAQSPTPQFEAQVLDDKVQIGYGLAIGDVDGDKNPDILMADKKAFVWYRNGDWKRFVMVENLTEQDNVCIAAQDIDGDGKVEVAVGAQWNPGETSDTAKSGSVHYLIRPSDPTQTWQPVKLHHEPTIHRMRWVKTGNKSFSLIVLPLHGKGNKDGQGEGVKVLAFEVPKNPKGPWKYQVIDQSMHMTHNLQVWDANGNTPAQLLIGGKEGVKRLTFDKGKWMANSASPWAVQQQSFGEVRTGSFKGQKKFIAGIEPMHGNMVTVYSYDAPANRQVLSETMNQGHALGCADFLGTGSDQIVAGWRNPDKENKVGVKLYIPQDNAGASWKDVWIDDNTMACEDLQIADLNKDGKPDIIAAGRASNNLKIYWNRTGTGK